ncbi:MAG TPA: M56 family metallopeptidase [Sphingomicrobium sp.]|nr:M56 family metallopeptidase [Sphingomicrobium sp.]
MTGWLLDTLLVTTVLILLVLFVREPVRKQFGARVTYGLWLIPAARLFMPTVTHTVERTSAAPILPLVRPTLGEPLSLVHVMAPDPSLLDRFGGWLAVFVVAWLGVAACLFASRMIAFHRDRRAVLDSSVEIARLGSVRIVRSPEVRSPVALGIFDKIVVLPADFDRLYRPRERRLVLEHELAHHRSGDLVANLFAFVLLCLQWFNPLAWVAHSAFRFDQEAACDARVLDKTAARDRADYGRAIARAASGRALLFASALDRRNSLHRRLESMLRNTHPNRRIAGRLLVATAIAVALPLTATRAVEYVDTDVPAAAPVPAVHTIQALPAVAPATPVPMSAAVAVQPVAPVAAAPKSRLHVGGDLTINGDLLTIDGKTKRWEELTPVEKARVRSAVATARAALDKTHIDQARIMSALAAVPDRKKMEEIQRDVERARAGASAAAQNVGASSGELRRWGVNGEEIKANVRAALESVQGIDVEALNRQLATLDRQKIADSVAKAEQSMRAAKAELDRLDARMREDKER